MEMDQPQLCSIAASGGIPEICESLRTGKWQESWQFLDDVPIEKFYDFPRMMIYLRLPTFELAPSPNKNWCFFSIPWLSQKKTGFAMCDLAQVRLRLYA
jgi:hypothetical protein